MPERKRFTCERCGDDAGLGGIHCDPCGASILRGLLGSPEWLAVRGVTRGDLPGETLADTMRRELAGLAVTS